MTGNTVSVAIQLAEARAQLDAVREIQDIDAQTLQLVQRENAFGAVPDNVVSATSQLAADQTRAPGSGLKISAARHALAVLLGRAPARSGAAALG